MRYRRGRAARRSPDRSARDSRVVQVDSLESDLQWLVGVLRPYSIELDPGAQERILLFSRELLRWNDRLNLLSRSDAQNVIRKHVAASIGVFLVVQPTSGERWIDVGTGGGFPGLVLQLVRPTLPITLIDSSRKRCRFLESVLRGVGQGDGNVLPMRAESLLTDGREAEGYDVLTTRAVTSLRDTVRLFGPLVSRTGRMVTFKGPRWAEDLAEANATGSLEKAGFELASVTRIPWAPGHLIALRRVDPAVDGRTT